MTTYKHGSEGTVLQIDDELKHISNNLGIGDQIEQMKKREAFISLKDHKENFGFYSMSNILDIMHMSYYFLTK